LTAWRLTKRKNIKTAFTGEGARLFGGRWNHAGTPLVYTAGSQSLAALEILVHLGSAELLQQYVIFQVDIAPSLVIRVTLSDLPRDWRTSPAPESARSIGDEWIRAGTSAALQMPSVLIPAETNFLLNPRHPDFSKVEISKAQPFEFDPRFRAQE
jgi:RES domain-containing protein